MKISDRQAPFQQLLTLSLEGEHGSHVSEQKSFKKQLIESSGKSNQKLCMILHSQKCTTVQFTVQRLKMQLLINV